MKLLQDEMRASQPKSCTFDCSVATTWCLKAWERTWVNPECCRAGEATWGFSYTGHVLYHRATAHACEFYVKSWVELLARKSKVHSELSTAVATGKTDTKKLWQCQGV